MATPIKSTSTAPLDSVYDDLEAATTLEQQIAILAEQAHKVEQAYNVANPTETVNYVSIAPDFNGNQVVISFSFPLVSTAPSLALNAAIDELEY